MANRDGVAGGGFNPAADYTTTGDWTMQGNLTVNGTITDSGSALASPAITGTVTGGATYTAPVLTTPTLGVAAATSLNKVVVTAPTTAATLTLIDGSSLITAGAFAVTLTSTATTGVTLPTTGTLATLAGAETLTNKTITGAVNTDYKVLAGSITYTSNIVPATITGFSWTVVPGTYVFDVYLPTTMTTNGGLELSFLLTTAVLTSIRYDTYAATASDNTTAVSTTGTTAASGTAIFDSKVAAYTVVKATGSMVVGTGGTFAWQGCQETSAGGGDVSLVLIGAYARMTRVA